MDVLALDTCGEAGTGARQPVEEAGTDRLPRHEAVALDVLRVTLTAHGHPAAGCRARVRRHDDNLLVSLYTGDIDKRMRSTVAVRVGGALRAFDTHTPRMSIAVTTA